MEQPNQTQITSEPLEWRTFGVMRYLGWTAFQRNQRTKIRHSQRMGEQRRVRQSPRQRLWYKTCQQSGQYPQTWRKRWSIKFLRINKPGADVLQFIISFDLLKIFQSRVCAWVEQLCRDTALATDMYDSYASMTRQPDWSVISKYVSNWMVQDDHAY